jgi:CzcA family heavy metal efflux pump
VNLTRSWEERGAAILLLVCLLVVGGLYAAARMPAAIFPSVTFPLVKVIADVGEETAGRMMPTVTRPLEEAFHRVPGVRRVLSTTSRGSTEITAEFAWGTDMQVALQRVQAEVQRIRPDLPPDARVDVEWMNTSVFPVLGYAISSDARSLADLDELAEYTLKPALIRVPGVSQVQIQGGRKREFQVHLDVAALAGRKLAPSDVVQAIRKSNQTLSAGLVEANHELYLSLVDGRARTRDALAEIAVPVAGGMPVRLSGLGQITAAEAVSYVRTTADGHPAVLLNVVQQPSANTIAIARSVATLLREHPDLIPKDVRWSTFYDQAEFVQNSVGGVRDAIAIGILLAVGVLFLFLRKVRTTLLAAATIPLCVALVFLGLAVAGQTVNLMTLGGVAAALGLVADDAIVVIENIHRQREQSGHGVGAQSATLRILPALLGSSLSTIVVFLPFALLTGVSGAFFRPLALTMAIALAASFVLSAVVLPVAVNILERRPAQEQPPSAEPRGAARLARFVTRHAAAAGSAVLLLYLAGFALYRAVGSDFLPAMDEGSIILDYWTPPGTSLTETDRMLGEAEKIIMAVPDVRGYSRRTGTELGFFITEPNAGDYVIRLKPRATRRPVDEVTEDLRKQLASQQPAIRTDFGQLLEDDIGDLTGGVPQPIVIKIFGEDQAVLQQKARLAADVLRSVKGVDDVFDGIVIAGPPLNVNVRPAEAARHGLTTEDVQTAIEPALVGTVAGDVRLGERVYDVRVFHGSGLSGLRLRSASGALVPLEDVARIETEPPEAEISRDSLRTYLGVTARLSGRSLGDAVAEIRRKLDAAMPLPRGMSLEFGGQYEQQQSSFKALLGVLLAGLLLVSVVVLFEFGDWRAPLLTSLLSLASLTGVFAALLVTDMTLNISSFVGAIMVVGIVGENAIFVIHEARLALRRGAEVHEAWAEAASRRTRPVVMTVLAGAFALAPLALALGEGSQLQQPLAIAVIGGFVLSGPIVLMILPALYAWIDPRGRLAGVPARPLAADSEKGTES